MEVERCLLDANVALNSGGAVRVNLGGPGTSVAATSLRIRESEFAGNSASRDGGALSVIMGEEGVQVVSLVDCRGVGNVARSGAAISQPKQQVSLSESDVLIGAQNSAVADNRWSLLSFRTSTKSGWATPLSALKLGKE